MHRSLTRRAGLAACAALTLLATAAGCGKPDDDGSGTGGDGKDTAATDQPSGGAEPGAFPVTIEHRFGSTTIEEDPERVVTVGYTDQDAVLALGETPVGVTDWLGMHDHAIGPWASDLLGDAEPPKVLKDTGTGPQLEEITLLKPDVILALYSGITKEQYDSLSQIAPVVAAPEEYQDYGIPWQEQTLITGQALGQPKAARQLVEEVEDTFAEIRREHPEFGEETAVVATPYEGFFLYGREDTRTRLLTDVGFSLPKGLDDAIGDQFGANISRERTDLLDQSAVVWIVPDPDKDAKSLHDDPLYGDLAVVNEGREIFVDETTGYGAAFSFGTVLSLPYVAERLVPQLEAAIDGDPDTEIPEPQD